MIFKLNNGIVIKIDKRDSRLLEGKAWTSNRFGYVVRSRYIGRKSTGYPGKYKTEYLHKLILSEEGYETDHINNNKLDNRRVNLRLVNRFQNQWNSPPYKGRKHKGAFITKFGTWQVKVGFMGRQYYFGTYKTLDEAKSVYDREAKRLHGEYANLNGGIS